MNEEKTADLHVHTIYSDSTLTPEQAVSLARERGLAAIAITDHDEVAGIEPARSAAAGTPLEVIPGVELTAGVRGHELHILGFYIDCRQKEFLAKMEYVRQFRRQRMQKMITRLAEQGIRIDLQQVLELSGPGSVGRVHLAQVLYREGKVNSPAEAFGRYIGENRPCYVRKAEMSFTEAIGLIIGTGGVPVLAHPRVPGRDELIPQMVKAGLQGIEVYHPDHNETDTGRYAELARRHRLLVTGGSDCHGEHKEGINLGSISVPYRLVEELKAAARRGGYSGNSAAKS